MEILMDKKILEWIQKQGYPLEMKVADLFKRSGFSVIQSDYYKDIDTGISREIDIIAYIQKVIDNHLIRIEFIIECKTSHDKPFVLFTSNTRFPGVSRVAQRAASTLGMKLLRLLAKRTDVQKQLLFQLPARTGYGITQAFGSGNDKAYEAAMSVSKATAAAVEEANAYEKSEKIKVCSIFMPIIVLSAKLVESYLGEDGNVAVENTNEAVLLWRNQVVKRPHTIITIITEDGLAMFAQRMYSSAANFIASLENEGINKILGRLTTG
jgi:hypothetical protein